MEARFGNLVLSLTLSVVVPAWVRDSQSGIGSSRGRILPMMKLESDGMSLAKRSRSKRCELRTCAFGDLINYSSRFGRDQLHRGAMESANLAFLFKKRFAR